jgi:hypothetical protein
MSWFGLHFFGSGGCNVLAVFSHFFFGSHTDEKENEIFLIYKEIQMGSVAKSYVRKGFLIYEEMRKYFSIYEEAT